MYLPRFSFANCIRRALHSACYFQWNVLITNPRFRVRSLFPSPLFHSRFCFFDPRSSVLFHSLSPSLALFLVIVAKQKALHRATENASRGAQPADYIVKCTPRRNYEAVDLCAGCLPYKRHFAAASLNYGLIIGRRIIKKLSRLLSGAHRES